MVDNIQHRGLTLRPGVRTPGSARQGITPTVSPTATSTKSAAPPKKAADHSPPTKSQGNFVAIKAIRKVTLPGCTPLTSAPSHDLSSPSVSQESTHAASMKSESNPAALATSSIKAQKSQPKLGLKNASKTTTAPASSPADKLATSSESPTADSTSAPSSRNTDATTSASTVPAARKAKPKVSLKSAANTDNDTTGTTDTSSVSSPEIQEKKSSQSTATSSASSESKPVHTTSEKDEKPSTAPEKRSSEPETASQVRAEQNISDELKEKLHAFSHSDHNHLYTASIEQYSNRHGKPISVVLQPVGRAGVRITLIARDGILGDRVVASLEQAEEIIAALPDTDSTQWSRDLSSKVVISAQHWKKMAGWVAKSHRFPRSKKSRLPESALHG